MTIIETTISDIDLDTKVSVRTESSGRKRTTQKRSYTLELDDGSTALYLGNGDFKKKDKLLLVSKERKDGKKLITAYQNLTQNKQGPTQQELRSSFGLGIFLFVFGLFMLIIGSTQQANTLLFVGIAVILYTTYFVRPALGSARALRNIKNHQSNNTSLK